MIENGKIEAEELRFIYRLLLDGRSDSEILDEYLSLKETGKLNFPLRTDISFINDKRNELEIASEVLKDGIKRIINLFLPKQRDVHFTQIADISAILLENNLDKITERLNVRYGSKSKYLYSSKYIIKDSNNSPLRLDKMQLIEVFRRNVENACKLHGISFFFDSYVPHLKASMNGEMDSMGGFWPAVEKNPYEVIRKIKDATDSRELKGNCPLCKIETQLPPLIRSTYSDIFQNLNHSPILV